MADDLVDGYLNQAVDLGVNHCKRVLTRLIEIADAQYEKTPEEHRLYIVAYSTALKDAVIAIEKSHQSMKENHHEQASRQPKLSIASKS